MNAEWITWALQGLLVLAVSRVWISLDKNTDSIAQFREEIPKTYATKVEMDRHYEDDRNDFRDQGKKIHDLTDKIHQVALLQAKAQLERHL